MKTGTVIIAEDTRGQYFVTVKAKNNKTLYTARGYNSRRNALKGFLAFQKALKLPLLTYK